MWSGLGSALVGGALGIGGSLLGSVFSAQHADTSSSKAYYRQLDLMRKQQAWAERMSNTAHQREVKDLRAAGLNPILSATGGQGASSPVVSASSVAQSYGVDYGDLGFGEAGDYLANSGSKALDWVRAKGAKDQIKSDIAVNEANASAAKAAAKVSLSQVKRNSVLTALDEANIDKVKAEKRLIDAQARDVDYTAIHKIPGRALHLLNQFINGSDSNSGKTIHWKDLFDFYKNGGSSSGAKRTVRFGVEPAGEIFE